MSQALRETDQVMDQRFSWATFRRLLGYVFRHKKLFVLGASLILLGTAAALSEPRLFGYAIDEAIVPKKGYLLKQLVVLYLFVVCVRVSALIAQAYIFDKLGQRVMQDLRLAVFSHLNALPVSTFDQNPVGRLVTRVTNDISSMAEMFSGGFVAMAGNILIVIGTLTWLFVLNFKLGLITASVLPVLFYFSARFSRRLREAYRNARSRLSMVNAFLAENILGMKVIHLFSRKDEHLRRFARINQSLADAQISSVRVFAYFQPTITWCSGLAIALVIWFGGAMTDRGEIKLGVLVAFFSYVLAMFQPMREIVDKWTVFLSGMTAAERIFAIMDWKTEMPVRETVTSARPIERLQGHIVFENVWFSYDQNTRDVAEPTWVLKDFSLEIKPGMHVGVVGHTGAGKSTLISLLMRFYTPQKGRILIDGKDIREYDRRSLRTAIGLVQQDVFLFSGSVQDNLTLWKDYPETAQLLRTMNWVKNHDQNLDERGSNLSVGERQMLSFTRAMLSSPKIWILDEATANVDSNSERQLTGALEDAADGRTLISIAHRLATVRDADLIIVLHKGGLAEKGTHGELMAQEGLYHRLYTFQSGQTSYRVEQNA